jgi:hypothetical protein
MKIINKSLFLINELQEKLLLKSKQIYKPRQVRVLVPKLRELRY